MRCTLLSLQVSLVTAIYLYFHQAISFDRLNKYTLLLMFEIFFVCLTQNVLC